MNIVISRAGQTVFDIALRELGDPSGVFVILAANAFLRMDYCLPAGVKILIPDGNIIRADIVDYYSRNNIYPATGDGVLATIDPQYMVEIIQTTAYDISAGAKSFDGQRLYNLKGQLTVQVNYSNISLAATAFVEQSLDGISFNAIGPEQLMKLSGGSDGTFNL
jgi:hypothetical protein